MSRRIDVELTSARADGTWTWRAAAARQPKGVVDGGLLPSGAAVGDVVKVDVESGLDGLSVSAVFAPKGTRSEPERLELLTPAQSDQLVTTTLAKGGPGGRPDRERREGRDDSGDARRRRPRSPDAERTGPRPGAREGSGRGGSERSRPRRDAQDKPAVAERRPARREVPAADARPRPKRLRPGRVHRKAALAELPGEQQVIADQVLQGGIPAVRQAVAKQNSQARAEGHPEVRAEPLVAIAEDLLPRLRTAEWHDRADAALDAVDELDLRDLRSVVVASDTAARTDETRQLAQRLRDALTQRVDREQATWLQDLSSALSDGRIVRALKLSSRPPKAGSPLPADLSTRLIEATSAALTAGDGPDRWATVLDALQFAPVHQRVQPETLPASPSEELLTVIRKAAGRMPQIAARFGIEATPSPAPRPKGQGTRRRPAPPGNAAPLAPAAKPVPPPPPMPVPATVSSGPAASDPVPDPAPASTAPAPAPAPDQSHPVSQPSSPS